MAQDPISAAGARLDALLQAKEARARLAKASVNASANPGALFVLPDTTPQSSAASADAGVSDAPNMIRGVPVELGVGATFRRSGVATDVPMRVNRLGDSLVFATYTDNEGSREVAFMANQVDVVTRAPLTQPDVATAAFEMPAVEAQRLDDAAVSNATVNTASSNTASSNTASSNTASSTVAPDPVAPVYVAPVYVAPVYVAPASTAPATLADLGVGATFHRQGVAWETMAVTRVGNGVVFANYTDDLGATREVAFIPNQLTLITRAP